MNEKNKEKFNNDYIKLVERCKQWRKMNHISQREFGNIFDLPYSTICSFEQGRVFNVNLLLCYLKLGTNAIEWVFQDLKR